MIKYFCCLSKIIFLCLCCIYDHALYARSLPVATGDEAVSYPLLQPSDTSFLQLKEQLRRAAASGDERRQAALLGEMGGLCFHLGHFAQAMEYHLEAKALLEKKGNDTLLAANCNHLGNLYYYNRNPRKAYQSYQQALMLYRRAGNTGGIAFTYGELGHLFEKKQQYDSAFRFQRAALETYRQAGDRIGTARIYENLGSIFEDLAQNDSALHYFRLALAYYRDCGQTLPQIEVYNNIGDIFRKTGHYAEGLQYTREALRLAARHRELYQLSSGYRDVAKTYHLMGRDDSAFYYSELSRSRMLEIYSLEGSRQMSFLQTLYEVEKKNNEIRTLQNARRVNMILVTASLLIAVLLLTLVFFIVSRHRIRLRSNRALADNERQIYEARSRLMEAELKARALEQEALETGLANERLEQEKLAMELKNVVLEEAQLKQQVAIRTRELSTKALHVIQKNQLLESLKGNLETLVKEEKRDHKKQLRQIIQQISHNFNNDGYWDDFRHTFEQVHQSFFTRLNEVAPNLSAAEIRLISLLRMNMNSQEIATMLGISADSLRVARYRLRKKLHLAQGENLTAFLQGL